MGPVHMRFNECDLFQQTLKASIIYGIIELMFIILKPESFRKDQFNIKILGFKISDTKCNLVS